MSEKTLHIVELRAENVKRLKAITIRPDGAMVVIGGRNAQGKTSTLDAIEMALAGGRTIPAEPVRRGERKGRIVVDLGDIVVERTFSPKGTALTVTGKDGTPVASPQKLLDTLCSKVAFDPLAFARMDPKEQDRVLKDAIGLDFSDLETARARLFAQRTEKNREIKRLEAQAEAQRPQAGPDDLKAVSVGELTAELERRQALADHASESKRAFEAALAKLREKLDEKKRLEERLAAISDEAHELKNVVERAEVRCDTDAAAAEAHPIAEIRDKLRNAEEINRAVRARDAYLALREEEKKTVAEADALTDALQSIDEEKAERLANAKFPIAGLGFDETGPTLNGLPLEQASQAERLRLSVAIGAALNPRVKVMLVRDGSLLDDESMRLIAELAAETDSQLWVERVGDSDPCAIVIEDGEERHAAEAAE